MKPTITAVIITKNEQAMIANCLDTLKWCDQVLVVDSGSTDSTIGLAQNWGATVVETKANSFAQIRNSVLQTITTDWIFYIDADERVTPQLAKEILVQLETTPHHAIRMHRQNMMYGKIFAHGGWSDEHVTRIFRRLEFKGWDGEIHESPVFEGETTTLHASLIHLTHRNTVDGLKKTISWTPIEAKLLHQANIPPVTLFTLIRKGMMEFVRRAFLKGGRKDGMEGVIEAVVQGINRVLVYIQVWELQQQPSLPEKYQHKELEIHEQWKKTALKDLSPLFEAKNSNQSEDTSKTKADEIPKLTPSGRGKK